MLDTRDRHGTQHSTLSQHSKTRTATTLDCPIMEGSHPHPQPRHVVSSGSSPELAAAQTEDDYYARGGEKKGRVKQVGRGRKRHLADDDTIDHHHPRSATSSASASASTSSSLYVHPAKSPKRPRTFDELEERAAATDEKQQQSAGSTDDDHLHQEMPDRDEGEEEEEVEEEASHHVVEEEEAEEEGEEDYDAVPHPPPRTWVAKAEWALGRLGGRGTLADIYATIEDAFPEEVDGKRNWKAAIRSCLSKNEKNKFFKPETMSAAKGDHVWCLAASSTPRRRGATTTTTKRGRPAGRARKQPSRTQGRRRSLSDEQQQQQQKKKEEKMEEEVKFAVPVLPARREKKKEEEERGRLETLLRWKQQLEQDISRLQEEVNEDGLSADQEDFLSQLLA